MERGEKNVRKRSNKNEHIQSDGAREMQSISTVCNNVDG